MRKNMSDRVPVKGTVSRATAEAMQRGEIESNNGLRKSYGKRSWNPEQPEFELDYGPTFGQMVAQAFIQEGTTVLWRLVFEDLIPAARYLFRTECVPALKRKLHELNDDRRKATQLIETEAEDVVPPSVSIINFDEYRKAVNQ